MADPEAGGERADVLRGMMSAPADDSPVDQDGDGVSLADICDAIREFLPTAPPEVQADLEQAAALIEKHATREEEGIDEMEGEETDGPPVAGPGEK